MGGREADLARNVAVRGHVKGDVAMGLQRVGVRLGGESGDLCQQHFARVNRGGPCVRENSQNHQNRVLVTR